MRSVAGAPELAPTLRTARLLNAAGPHRMVARVLLVLLVVVVAVLFLPWQQNVQGKGLVTALRPQDRPQVVPALIAGRIERWHVQEGAPVRKGDLLVEISEIKESFLDPRTVARTAEQVAAKEAALRAKGEKVAALTRQVEALAAGRSLGLDKARNTVTLQEASVAAAVVDSAVAAAQLARNQQLFADGLKSRAEFEAYQVKLQAAVAKLVERRQALRNASIELAAIEAEYDEKIAKASADRSATAAEIGEGRADVAKLRMQYAAMEIRQGMYRITAPQDGYVVRAVRAGIGETIKEGEPVVTVMPAHAEQAVELYVRPMDVPLLRPGRKVRLQFDGWPALQFSGWPSVSVGTFGGVIRVVDYVNAPDGTYRVLVAPDTADEPWPRELRVGSGALGWAMLDEVRVWFEIWRRFNGFPPSIRPGQPATGAKA
jgi:multidrug resistance efflux pump